MDKHVGDKALPFVVADHAVGPQGQFVHEVGARKTVVGYEGGGNDNGKCHALICLFHYSDDELFKHLLLVGGIAVESFAHHVNVA